MTVVDERLRRFTTRELRSALGAFPTGITVIGAVVDGTPIGLVANSFSSVSLDPPLVSIAAAHASTTWPVLAGRPRLGISVLGEDDHLLVAQLSRPAVERFDDVAWHEGSDGELVLDGRAAAFRVAPHSEVVAGDHTVAFLEVLGLEHDEEREPLVFHRSGLRRIA